MTHLHAVPLPHNELQWEPDPEDTKEELDELEEYFLHADTKNNVKSTDKRGHGDTLYVKFPPDVKNRVSQIASDPRTPYRSPHDFVRDAIVHHVVKIDARLNRGINSPMVKVFQANERAKSERANTEARTELVENAVQQIQSAVKNDDWDGLDIAIRNAENYVDIAGVNVSRLLTEIDTGRRQLRLRPQ